MPEQPVAPRVSLPQSTEQKRAKKAWSLVQAVKNEQYFEKYKSRAQGFGVDILSNGLLQTLAVYNSGDEHERKLVEHVRQWLFSGNEECSFPWGVINDQTLIERLCKCNTELYRKAQIETLAFILWLKRFSKG